MKSRRSVGNSSDMDVVTGGTPQPTPQKPSKRPEAKPEALTAGWHDSALSE